MRTEYMNPMIHKAFDLLESLSADELTRQRAEVREKALKNEISLLEDARMEGREEGREEGVDLGEEIGGIRALQRVLKIPVESKETLIAHSRQELQNMLQQLEAMLDARS